MELVELLTYGLPTGFIGSVVTWIITRKKQKNDMLQELQSSINMLSEENRKILNENIQLRKENAAMSVRQEEMLLRMEQLTREVERLRKVINKKTTTKNEKSNQGDDPAIIYVDPAVNNRVRQQKGNKSQPLRVSRDREHQHAGDGEHSQGTGSIDGEQPEGADEPNTGNGKGHTGEQGIGNSIGRKS
ncbi:MreC domain-containing protein [Viscerimonas tarda]